MPPTERPESNFAASDQNSSSVPLPVLPTRIITYAWGEKYIEILLTMTLPALLAPGNLPHVAASVTCELIILSQEEAFPKIRRHPAVRHIEESCPVRLVALDDLVSSPDQYGIALTHALHRGFSDLGPAMTDAWLIFLNADFILADGSLKNLLSYLQAGERLVAAPSYCVNAEEVLPELKGAVDQQRRSLTIAPRVMAELILRNRHNTIRAKTVNQSSFGIRWMDQFYWLHDSHTLLGHQMPVAIVGMRPERHVAEPNAYWDHGLMREYCPIAEPCVIGDSDEFLMLELRGASVAKEHLQPGLADPVRIARDWTGFVTPYQRDMLQYPLVLHAEDLPPGIEGSRRELSAFIERVLANVPANLASHIKHPQWTYHWPRFTRSRHAFMSRRLGPATETAKPHQHSSAIDLLWWRLDGIEKTYERRRRGIEYQRDCHRDAFRSALARSEKNFALRREELSARLPALLTMNNHDVETARATGAAETAFDPLRKSIENSTGCHHNRVTQIEENAQKLLELREAADEKHRSLAESLKYVESYHEDQLAKLAEEFELAQAPLRLEYEETLERMSTSSAVVPHVALREGPRKDAEEGPPGHAARLAWRAQVAFFGKLPHVRRISPFWAPLRHVMRIVGHARAAGAADVLVITGGSEVPNTFADSLPGMHAEVDFNEAVEGNLAISLPPEVRFDLCISDLATAQLEQFGKLARTVLPLVREGGKIIGFCPNFSLAPIDLQISKLLETIVDLPMTKIYYAGSEKSAHASRWFSNPSVSPVGVGYMNVVRGAAKLILASPSAFFASLAKEHGESPSSNGPCTSITIEISV